MSYRVPLVASAACIAAVSLTACGGGSDKASSRTSPSTVASTSSSATTPSSTSQTSTSTPSTTTVTRTASPSATTNKPAATKTTAAAPAKKDGCYTSDGKSLFLQGVSCGFAQNAYNVYKRGYVPNDTGQYQAYSPTTGKTYTFNCMGDDQGITNCGGGTMAPNSLFSWQG